MKSETNAKVNIIAKELVTVTVSASEGTVSDYKIQIIDSDSNVMYIQTTSNATYKIPYGTQYTVKSSPVDGFLTPPMQTYTASQSTRSIDVVYEADMKGVFIQDIYGRLYTQDEWDGTQIANGVAVITDNCSFVVAKEDALSSNIYWGGRDIDIPTLTNYNNRTDAATDFDGLGNTSKIITALGNTNDGYSGYAAAGCRNYIFSNGVNGYLGSAGELQAIHDNKEVINSLLALIGGQLIASGHYWTSTERDSERAFETWFGDVVTVIYDNYKYNDFRVRSLAKLISQDDIITFYINNTKHSCVKGTTWGQWCKSSFNTDGWYVDSDGKTIVREFMPEEGIVEYVKDVLSTDIIESDFYIRGEKDV